MNDFKEIAKFQFESAQARLERVIIKLWIVIIILVFMLMATGGALLYLNMQYETTEQTTIKQEVDTDNGNAYVMDGIHIGECRK